MKAVEATFPYMITVKKQLPVYGKGPVIVLVNED